MNHVLPVNDLKEHAEDTTCDCMPNVFEEEGEMFCIHNSYDKRELYEDLPLVITCEKYKTANMIIEVTEEDGKAKLKRLKYVCGDCNCGGIETDETKSIFLELNDLV